ncbi:uncharacterized protein LOC129578684 [Sitodiplosis mosellana]|uniref:uncharacterized protein LOC129578684 n=1 Tax=Sitodiplosis mosellana TaxID=263140 RepID=UPI002444BED3|nr:uncharacterized protein LOC129578684 [Sitodiplosis mosellana]
MHRYSIALLVFLTLFWCGRASAQCKGLGQYCTSHSDCCSNSCLSYSYRCVELHDNHQYDTELATVNNIEELVNRFGGGGGGDVAATNTYQTHPSEMTSTSYPVQTDQPTTLTPHEIGSSESSCRTDGNLCSSSDQCCTKFCSKITNLCIHPTADSLSTEQITSYTRPSYSSSTANAPCQGIGQKCYATAIDECCPPLRCHGFLHQCVT